MIPYYSIFFISFILMFCNDISNSNSLEKFNQYFKKIFLVVLFIFVAFRYKVGADWNSYNDLFDSVDLTDSTFEIGYLYLIKFSLLFEYNIWGLNIFSSLIFFTGFYLLFKDEKYFWFAVNLSLPYLIFIVSMGYIRQSIAIGFGMMIFKFLLNNNKLYQLFFLFMSMLFHYTSIIYAGFILYNIKNNFLKVFSFIVIISILYYATNEFQEFLRYIKFYVQRGAESKGGIPRLILSSIPIFFYIIKFNQIKSSKYNKLFFLYTLLVFLLFFTAFFSSTSADRILLYILPLKIILLLKLIEFIKNKYIYIYSLTLIFILSFHIHTNYSISFQSWIPYQNLLTLTEYNYSIYFPEVPEE